MHSVCGLGLCIRRYPSFAVTVPIAVVLRRSILYLVQTTGTGGLFALFAQINCSTSGLSCQ